MYQYVCYRSGRNVQNREIQKHAQHNASRNLHKKSLKDIKYMIVEYNYQCRGQDHMQYFMF